MRGPDIRVVGPRPALGLALGFAFRRTLLHAVPEVGELPPGAPGDQVVWQRAPPVSAQPRTQGELWRVERVDRERLGGVRKWRRVVVVVLILLEQRVVAG